ncbi:MAG TPA: addiction module protein [Candidatus Eisenbacteria bacterium]|jgi:putative addiction module component (TIGR02574 family)
MSDQLKDNESDDLSVPEKIHRVQDLWDEIARSPQEVDLTPAQREEAERRLRRHESSPGTYTSWEEVKRRLESER